MVTKRTTRTTVRRISYIPYVSGITDRLKKILQKERVAVRYNTVQKVRHILPTAKDEIPKLHAKDIYQLEYGNVRTFARGTHYHQRIVRKSLEICT